MQNITGVKFKNSGKIYTFSTSGLDLCDGDMVVVETASGISMGKVVFTGREIDESDLAEPLKPIVRKATEKDINNYQELERRAEKDLITVKQKVKELGLEMKIVSAEYLLDGSKIVIEFCADDRVDFRELLKELASEFKVRIELHQVGQRDEVKIKGGIGPCGEICCCSRFLNDFEHVTVKMAKTQGLSLNPTKISGLCGRLMCCLAYENKGYEEVLAKMPKLNGLISTPKGNGVVVYNDILRERVSVKVLTGEDSYTIYDFSLQELNGNGKTTSEKDRKESVENKEQKDAGRNNQKTDKSDKQNQESGKSEEKISQQANKKDSAFDKDNKKFKKHRHFNNSHKNANKNINK